MGHALEHPQVGLFSQDNPALQCHRPDYRTFNAFLTLHR
jgi:hypothetical protein